MTLLGNANAVAQQQAAYESQLERMRLVTRTRSALAGAIGKNDKP